MPTIYQSKAPNKNTKRPLKYKQKNKQAWLKLIRKTLDEWQKLKDIEPYTLIVNIPTYQLYGMSNEGVELQQKVVIGRSSAPTPCGKTNVSGVTVHPSWVVPRGIFLRSLKNKIMANPNYLKSHNYTVSGSDGKTLDPHYINWSEVGRNYFPYIIIQKPGPYNALGTIRFHLEGFHSIHMHDTPSRSSFSKADRALSAGCIRLEKPYDLAKWLGLECSPKSRAQYAKPGLNVPVYITYIRLWFDGENLIIGDDPYKKLQLI